MKFDLTLTGNKKLPPAPGCVEQKLTNLTLSNSNGILKHDEIPIANRDTPYALQKLLEIFKNYYLDTIETMKSTSFKENLEEQISVQRKRKEELVQTKEQLERQIKGLIEDSTSKLRAKLEELDIPGDGATADTLLSEVINLMK